MGVLASGKDLKTSSLVSGRRCVWRCAELLLLLLRSWHTAVWL